MVIIQFFAVEICATASLGMGSNWNGCCYEMMIMCFEISILSFRISIALTLVDSICSYSILDSININSRFHLVPVCVCVCAWGRESEKETFMIYSCTFQFAQIDTYKLIPTHLVRPLPILCSQIRLQFTVPFAIPPLSVTFMRQWLNDFSTYSAARFEVEIHCDHDEHNPGQ